MRLGAWRERFAASKATYYRYRAQPAEGTTEPPPAATEPPPGPPEEDTVDAVLDAAAEAEQADEAPEAAPKQPRAAARAAEPAGSAQPDVAATRTIIRGYYDAFADTHLAGLVGSTPAARQRFVAKIYKLSTQAQADDMLQAIRDELAKSRGMILSPVRIAYTQAVRIADRRVARLHGLSDAIGACAQIEDCLREIDIVHGYRGPQSAVQRLAIATSKCVLEVLARNAQAPAPEAAPQ
jgi:hypothetical protein